MDGLEGGGDGEFIVAGVVDIEPEVIEVAEEGEDGFEEPSASGDFVEGM